MNNDVTKLTTQAKSLHRGLLEMGCDGGSIPRRDEMVKLKKKAEKVREMTPILIDNSCVLYLCPRLTKMLSFRLDGCTAPSVEKS